MKRIWQIAWTEYKGHITRRSYLLFTFGFPLFMLLMPIIGGVVLSLAIWAAMPTPDLRPVGVVDQPSLIAEVAPPDAGEEQPLFRQYETTADAAAAFEAGEIQAYYDIQPDYWETGEIIAVYDEPPIFTVEAAFEQWVSNAVRAEVTDSAVLRRAEAGPDFIHQDVAGESEFSFADISQMVIIFMVIYFVRLGGSFTAEYMFGSIARESHDRTLEILITSVTPLQFVIGKLIGLTSVGLTQLGAWAGFAVTLSVTVSYFFGFNLLSVILGWEYLWLLVSISFAAYILDQMLAATLGMFRVSGGAGTLVLNSINWVVGLGLIYAIYFVPRNPDAILAVTLSIFPVTAPIVLLVRVIVSEVPYWQIVAAQVSLWGTIVASVFWLRWLLERNLVSYTPPFKLREWLGKWLSPITERIKLPSWRRATPQDEPRQP